MSPLYDIAIIGLGPAGSTLARLLKPELKVAAIDRKKLDGSLGGFQKPCGGLLSPGAQKMLASQGLNLPNSVLADPQIFTVRTMDLKIGLERHYQRCYVNMDRHRFDLWLASLISPSVDVFSQAACRSIERKSSHFEITFIKNNKMQTIKSRLLIGADGSASLVRRLFAPQSIRRYVCLQHYYPGLANLPYGCFFHPDITDCYGWINHKDGEMVLGAALPLKQPARRFEEIKKQLRAFGYDFSQKPLKVEAAQVSRPTGLHQIQIGHGGFFLLGEAAGLVSPSSLEGISYALGSAFQLSGILNRRPEADQAGAYSRSLWHLRFKLLNRKAKVPFMYNPALRRLVMASRIDSMSVMG